MKLALSAFTDTIVLTTHCCCASHIIMITAAYCTTLNNQKWHWKSSYLSLILCRDSPCFCSNSWMSFLGSSSVSVSPSLSGSSAAGEWGWDWGWDWSWDWGWDWSWDWGWDWSWDWDWDWLTDRIWIFIPRSGASEPKKAAGPSIPTEGE